MNILLTNTCNRRCTYCFAQERVSLSGDPERPAGPVGPPEHISRESFATAVDFAVRSRIGQIGLLGGEPSLHPEFVSLVRHCHERGLDTKIFSNGLWRDEDVAAFAAFDEASRRRTTVIVNVNEPTRTPPAQARRQRDLMARLGRLCSLSFNISRIDFDPTFLPELVVEHGLKPTIRLGVAEPLAAQPNEHVDVADYAKLAPTLIDLAERCDAHDVSIGFDCGFVLCMFDTRQLGRLVECNARFRSSCGPAVDVGTDLSTWACFPLSTFTRGKLLTDFQDLAELGRYFRREFAPLFRAGALPACRTCKHRRRRQCSGGCAAHVYRRLNPQEEVAIDVPAESLTHPAA